MKFLALDTTKLKSYIFLIDDEKQVVRVLEETRKVSENLLLEVDSLLLENGLTIGDIDVFGAVVGPGSFTGVRIGLATLKAFNNALNKKLIKLNAFEAFGNVIKNGVLILSSTKTSVYFAKFENSEISEMGVAEIDKLKELLGKNNCYIIEESLKGVVGAEFINNYEDCIITAFKNKIDKKEFASEQEFAPLYLQLSQAELNLKRKLDSEN